MRAHMHTPMESKKNTEKQTHTRARAHIHRTTYPDNYIHIGFRIQRSWVPILLHADRCMCACAATCMIAQVCNRKMRWITAKYGTQNKVRARPPPKTGAARQEPASGATRDRPGYLGAKGPGARFPVRTLATVSSVQLRRAEVHRHGPTPSAGGLDHGWIPYIFLFM